MKINQITVGYQDLTVIENLTLEVGNAEFCAILGPNGAGKSTLLKSLIGYIPLQKGKIEIDGKDISDWNKKKLAQKISLIPQDFQLQFDHNVRELILMGRFPYLGYWESYSKKDYDIVERIIRQLDLQTMADKKFSQLSGGERQRVAIARALAQEAATILMDEAFSHLDVNHQIEIMQLLSKINKKQKKRILLVSHNLNLACEYCDRVIMLKKGKLIADGSPNEVVTKENIKKLFGAELLIVKHPISGKPNIIYPESSKE
jgi:iron complex transport system ATP-binding protein